MCWSQILEIHVAATARASVTTAIYSALAAAAGNAAYRWWRHGVFDWVGELEFALGWGIGTIALQGIGRWWEKRKQSQAGTLVNQD
jgi:hypothetical protein